MKSKNNENKLIKIKERTKKFDKKLLIFNIALGTISLTSLGIGLGVSTYNKIKNPDTIIFNNESIVNFKNSLLSNINNNRLTVNEFKNTDIVEFVKNNLKLSNISLSNFVLNANTNFSNDQLTSIEITFNNQ